MSNAGLSVNEFLKLLKTIKDLIFHNDNIPKTNQMSQVHAVGLQMFSKGLIKLTVTDKTKLGTSKVMSADIAMKVCVKDIKRNGRRYQTPCHMIDDYWNGINVSD